jgi:hypothetical protein
VLEAGPLGVPEPFQDLAEMIALVACGHTIGSVHGADFPNLVRQNNSDPSGVGLAFLIRREVMIVPCKFDF